MTPDEIIEVLQGFKAGRGWQFLSTANEWKTPILSSLESMLHALYSQQTIRLAPLPDEITIPARVIPAPLREALKDGDEYYALDLWDSDGVTLVEWGSDRLDFELLADGLVFATREHAIKFRKAMCPYA